MPDRFEVSKLLREHLHSEVKITKEIGSNVNHTYFIQSGKDEFLAKIMTRSPLNSFESNRFLKSEVIFNKLQKVGIDTPAIIHADNRKRTFGNDTVHGILIMEKLEIDPLDILWDNLDRDEKEVVAREMAKLLKSVHSIEFPTYGKIDVLETVAKFSSWDEFIFAKTKKAHQKLADMNIFSKGLLDEAVEFILDNQKYWTYTDTAKLVHHDIWRGNFLWNHEKLYLIDWEWSISGDPFCDLLWMESDIFNGEPKDLVDIFYKEYEIDNNTEKFNVKRRVLSTYNSLTTCAFGFVYHNPSEESFIRQKELLERNIYGKLIESHFHEMNL